MQVYVVSLCDPTGQSAVGGFDWHYNEADVPDEFVDATYIGAVDVPDGLTRDEITDWLDERPELWEVPIVEEHVHTWGQLERSRLAGTVHRKCTDPDCRVINALDDDEEEGE